MIIWYLRYRGLTHLLKVVKSIETAQHFCCDVMLSENDTSAKWEANSRELCSLWISASLIGHFHSLLWRHDSNAQTHTFRRPMLSSHTYHNYSPRTKGNCPKSNSVRKGIICILSHWGMVSLSDDTNNANGNHSHADTLSKPTFTDRVIG